MLWKWNSNTDRPSNGNDAKQQQQQQQPLPKCQIPDGIITWDLIECMHYLVLAILFWLHSMPTMGRCSDWNFYSVFGNTKLWPFHWHWHWHRHRHRHRMPSFTVTKFINVLSSTECEIVLVNHQMLCYATRLILSKVWKSLVSFAVARNDFIT